MEGRKLDPLISTPYRQRESMLEDTISSVLPLAKSGNLKRDHLPLGHHLIYFNPTVPSKELLSDGTDAIHSPGPPFNRRLWAGGKLVINVDKYFRGQHAWRLGTRFVCLERIRDVQLSGEGDAEKIGITIERRFASMNSLGKYVPKRAGVRRDEREARMLEAFYNEMSEAEGWGTASMIEERKIVFLKDRTAAEKAAFEEGNFQPVKYLDRQSYVLYCEVSILIRSTAPGEPEFWHKLVPTRELLAQYSALTDNAHLIHTGLHYTRIVEGHRNLLVHGPLALTLILRLVTNHLRAQEGPPLTIKSINYRNLAPLYCDEEMKLCGWRPERPDKNGNPVYIVWIEGPTGGMAFKGTVYTSRMDVSTSTASKTDALSEGTHEASTDYGNSTSNVDDGSEEPWRPPYRDPPVRSDNQDAAPKAPDHDSTPADPNISPEAPDPSARGSEYRSAVPAATSEAPQWNFARIDPEKPNMLIRYYKTDVEHADKKKEDSEKPKWTGRVRKVQQVVIRKTMTPGLKTIAEKQRGRGSSWRKDRDLVAGSLGLGRRMLCSNAPR
jgi:hydroxyacyl-ACP dehydratase HTD2-like protein with hotdog domain